MKLVTRPRLLILAVVVTAVGVGVGLDRRDAPMREGRVVVDAAFLHRLETENEETTRDPAIKALSSATFKGDILRNMLRTGAVTLEVHQLDRDSVEVTMRESFGGGIDSYSSMAYTRRRLSLREFLSPSRWKESFRHRGSWELGSYRGDTRQLLMPPEDPVGR